MNAMQRDRYHALVEAHNQERATFGSVQVQCSLCKFGYDPEMGCAHPLARSSNLGYPDYGMGPIPQEHASEGGDCWGFRPTAEAKKKAAV